MPYTDVHTRTDITIALSEHQRFDVVRPHVTRNPRILIDEVEVAIRDREPVQVLMRGYAYKSDGTLGGTRGLAILAPPDVEVVGNEEFENEVELVDWDLIPSGLKSTITYLIKEHS